MLKKAHRGISRKDIVLIQKKGRTIGNRLFKAWVLGKELQEPNQKQGTQFALIITKKTSKRAVTRNKLRRQIYEIIRSNYTDWAENRYCVISVKSTCLEVTFQELTKNLLHLLQQITTGRHRS
jgi:ribonuclease P protein component